NSSECLCVVVDDCILQRQQRVANCQQVASTRRTWNVDKTLVIEHKPFHQIETCAEEFRHTGAGYQLVWSRAAVAHSPNCVGFIEQDRTFCKSHDSPPCKTSQTILG